MKKISLLLTFLLPATLIFYACAGQNDHALKGTITGASNLQVLLEQAHFDRSNVALGRVTCDANGNFEIKQDKAFEAGLYRLGIGAKKMYFMLDGKENTVEIKGDLSTIDRHRRIESHVLRLERCDANTTAAQDAAQCGHQRGFPGIGCAALNHQGGGSR